MIQVRIGEKWIDVASVKDDVCPDCGGSKGMPHGSSCDSSYVMDKDLKDTKGEHQWLCVEGISAYRSTLRGFKGKLEMLWFGNQNVFDLMRDKDDKRPDILAYGNPLASTEQFSDEQNLLHDWAFTRVKIYQELYKTAEMVDGAMVNNGMNKPGVSEKASEINFLLNSLDAWQDGMDTINKRGLNKEQRKEHIEEFMKLCVEPYRNIFEKYNPDHKVGNKSEKKMKLS